MNNPVTMTADLTGLNHSMSELVAVLGKDSRELVRVESGQMAWRIAQQFGPKTASGGTKRIEKDIRRHLTIKPVRENIKSIHQGTGDIKWLYAGHDFVAGIQRENDMKSAAAAEAMRVYYKEKAKAPVNAWSKVGTRGKQNVMISNRVRVSRAAFAEVLRAIKANVGQAKSSFAFTTAKTTNKRIPTWISRHFPTSARGKALFTDGTKTGSMPFVEFGSRAKGVESNPRMIAAIQSGVNQTVAILRTKVEKLLNGYAYDFKTGAVFRPKSNTFERN